MKITLNKDSWHYRVFNNALPYTNPPKSLCPYFWILVGIIITYPFVAFANGCVKLQNKIASFFPKEVKVKPEKTWDEVSAEWELDKQKRKIKEARMEKIGKIFGKLFFFGFLPFIGLTVLYILFRETQKLGWYHMLAGLGMCLVIGAVLVGFITLVEWFFNKYATKMGNVIVKFAIIIFTPFKWIGWMIKAGYEKACPLVQWEGDIDNEQNDMKYGKGIYNG